MWGRPVSPASRLSTLPPSPGADGGTTPWKDLRAASSWQPAASGPLSPNTHEKLNAANPHGSLDADPSSSEPQRRPQPCLIPGVKSRERPWNRGPPPPGPERFLAHRKTERINVRCSKLPICGTWLHSRGQLIHSSLPPSAKS